MKKKVLIFAALVTVVLLAAVAVAHATLSGPDPNAASGFTNCPADWWTAGGAPVDAGDITGPGGTSAVNVQYDGCLTQQELSHIQPGLGTVMIEVGYRAWVMDYAARGGNWNLANYQAGEVGEIMETGVVTRPGKSNALLNFMDDNPNGLPGVKSAIAAKDPVAFNTAYANMINACNACHTGVGHPEVYYQPPTTKPDDLSLGVGMDLSLSMSSARWASYSDYLARTLSVDMTVSNIGKDTALNTNITAVSSNNGVTTVDSPPFALGDIAAASASTVTIRYNVPDGVTHFSTHIQAQTHDSSGATYNYPTA